MIPTYNPRPNFLEETLTSVLQQDPGPEQMQIEVVDDGSNDDTASEVTRRVGAGRVMFHHESENQGLANSWNRCVERARGDWVHILHQDDIVLPGFYDLLRKGADIVLSEAESNETQGLRLVVPNWTEILRTDPTGEVLSNTYLRYPYGKYI
jgi:glycosyltransferase involved in cell wall biosynthesis